jgi:hypothetical protein
MESRFNHDFSRVGIERNTRHSLQRLSSFRADQDTIKRWRAVSQPTMLASSEVQHWSTLFQQPLPSVYLHTDRFANAIAAAHNAEALTINNDV